MTTLETVLIALCGALVVFGVLNSRAAYRNGVTDGFGFAAEPDNDGYQYAGSYLKRFMAHRWPELLGRTADLLGRWDYRAAVEYLLERGPVPNTAWKHRRTGGAYRVVCGCLIEKGIVPAVVYASRDHIGSPFWVRPVAEFMDGRFEPVTEGRR